MPSNDPSAKVAEPPHETAASAAGRSFVDLSSFDNSDYDPGRRFAVQTLWYFVSLAVFESGWAPTRRLKVWLLRRFGARIGEGVVIKPHVRIKYPWRLTVGDHVWIGQGAWIDNIEDVEIGSHACISQLVYLCTGSHDYRRRGFDLAAKPIRVGEGAWLGARCTLLPGVTVGANALVAAGSIVTKHVDEAAIVAGNPARKVGERQRPGV